MSTPHSSNAGGITSNSKGRSNMFGRDEFDALLGGQDGLSEVLTRRTDGGKARSSTSTSSTLKNHKDISDMTVEETAALLKQQQQQKVLSHATAVTGSQQPRLRATSNRAREYHKLLEEQQLQTDILAPNGTQQPPQKQSFATLATSNNTSSVQTDQIYENHEDEEMNMNSTIAPPIRRRKKAAPVILVELGITDQNSKPQKPPRNDVRSNDDDSDSTNDGPPQRTRQMDSSDDDDNSSVDRRRQRALQKRKQQALDQSTMVERVDDYHADPERISTSELDVRTKQHDATINHELCQRPTSLHASDSNDTRLPSTNDIALGTSNLARQQHNASSDDKSSSDNEGSTSSSSSSSDDDSESESDDGVVKPVFIPKHRRTLIQSIEDEAAQRMEKEQQEKELKERRKRESRALLQETLMNAKLDRSNTNSDHLIDGITGALNDIPTDNDNDDDQNIRYEEWEVRELERILQEWDVEMEKERSEEERNQRRRRYAPIGKHDDLDNEIAEAPNRKIPMQALSSEASGRQRTAYHHRGAFFMEDTEDNDIRQKAMEYSGADASGTTAVYHDHQHRDRTQLPKVMQVKKFGFANQSKYRGLAAEDTTDKNLDILPIVHNKNRSKRF